MNIREATKYDWNSIWPIFHSIASAGETYGYDENTSKEQAEYIWLVSPVKTFIFEDNKEVVGTYYLKTNQAGPGNHVCNCGYMVDAKSRGKGVARLMCEHSQQVAIQLGYKAMQFNFVAASNEGAVSLWTKLGFDKVGCLPKAFNHPKLGYTDAFVMYKWL